MFFVSQGIDGWYIAELREIDDVLLVEGPNDTSMNHPTKYARSVFDRLAAAELDVIGREKHDRAAEFTHANFE